MNIPIWKNTNLTSLDGEEFKDIRGYWGMYQVSNSGRVKTLERDIRIRGGVRRAKEKILSAWITKKGQVYVSLHDNGIKINHLISNLVALEFIGNWKNSEWIIHKNKIEHDNRVENLMIGTPQKSILLDYELKAKLPQKSHKMLGKYDHHKVFVDKYGIVENDILVRINCRKCKTDKPIRKFDYDKKRKCQRYTCKECINKHRRERVG